MERRPEQLEKNRNWTAAEPPHGTVWNQTAAKPLLNVAVTLKHHLAKTPYKFTLQRYSTIVAGTLAILHPIFKLNLLFAVQFVVCTVSCLRNREQVYLPLPGVRTSNQRHMLLNGVYRSSLITRRLPCCIRIIYPNVFVRTRHGQWGDAEGGDADGGDEMPELHWALVAEVSTLIAIAAEFK